jgi:hypothetical protein
MTRFSVVTTGAGDAMNTIWITGITILLQLCNAAIALPLFFASGKNPASILG